MDRASYRLYVLTLVFFGFGDNDGGLSLLRLDVELPELKFTSILCEFVISPRSGKDIAWESDVGDGIVLGT